MINQKSLINLNEMNPIPVKKNISVPDIALSYMLLQIRWSRGLSRKEMSGIAKMCPNRIKEIEITNTKIKDYELDNMLSALGLNLSIHICDVYPELSKEKNRHLVSFW